MAILYSRWLETPFPLRMKLAREFNIPKKGPTEVFNDTIKSDGYIIKDIEAAMTLSAIQKYLGTDETDLHVLWGWLVDKMEGKEVKIVSVGGPSRVQTEASKVSTISKEEADKFNKEYEERTGKKAPVAGEEFNNKPKRGRSKKVNNEAKAKE